MIFPTCVKSTLSFLANKFITATSKKLRERLIKSKIFSPDLGSIPKACRIAATVEFWLEPGPAKSGPPTSVPAF